MKDNNPIFPIYGSIKALMRMKGEQSWSSFGCFRYPCFWYEKATLQEFCRFFVSRVNRIDNSCEFEFAVKVGRYTFLLVERDGKFSAPVEFLD